MDRDQSFIFIKLKRAVFTAILLVADARRRFTRHRARPPLKSTMTAAA